MMNTDRIPLPPMGNLFSSLPRPKRGEVFDELLRVGGARIERIVSSDRPQLKLYDQDWDEWVCLLRGEAELQIGWETVFLRAGDHVHLPAHTPHRIIRTSREPSCVWLAVHLPVASETPEGA